MKISSIYSSLRWIVEVKWPGEIDKRPIAAFDREATAHEFARAAAQDAGRGGAPAGTTLSYHVSEYLGGGDLITRKIYLADPKSVKVIKWYGKLAVPA